VSDWRTLIHEEWTRRHKPTADDNHFPLMNQGFDSREIIAAVESLLSGQITMGNLVRQFEKKFASFVGARHAVMVNSGSSANLLAVSAASNPARRNSLQRGDEILVPAVCWSTSVWPIVQLGMKPVFVDVDPATLNVSIDAVRRAITRATRGIMVVHVLGNSSPMEELLRIVEEQDLILIEDTCESLGSIALGRPLGSHGSFGTYSFYYSHHITTGEGGMVVCNDPEDRDLLRCLRAHGWSRELSTRNDVEARNPKIDPRFLFVNLGFNVRPLEVQAAFGLEQLDRLSVMTATRNENRRRLIECLQAHPAWGGQLQWTSAGKGTEPAWFGFSALLNRRTNLPRYLRELDRRGVENRPIISGNFARQPALSLLGIQVDPANFPGAERVHDHGFFIGLHSAPLSQTTIQRLADILLT
jgi:CDP-4-dehydro-6-deoxyglucose reductase, E1